MKTVYKYPLVVDDEQRVRLPFRHTLLAVQVQHDQPCLWAVVDTESNTAELSVYTRGTGHDMDGVPGDATYIGTYQLYNGNFIGHVWTLMRGES